MKQLALLLVYLFFSPSADPDQLTEKTTALLQQYVKDGLVDYGAVKQNFEEIDQLYRQIGETELQGASESEKKAFYINAYNVIVIHQIAQNYPVQSPQDIKGFFDRQKHSVAGQQLTLNALEKEKLLKPYQDPRIHFVLVCAALSCPPIAKEAYQPGQLDDQLDAKTRQALNNSNFIRVMPDKKKVALSRIFDWYKEDFVRQGQSLISYVNQYRDQKIPAQYAVDFYEYDWRLNEP